MPTPTTSPSAGNPEADRLAVAASPATPWKLWGPYVSERQWGTVREDYSPDGDGWDYFPHDHARSRAYRWGEDGLGGISDEHCRLCLAVALWNGQDAILKERLFGLTNSEGNHGEDVKECYYYLDATPTHSYLKMLYKYPQQAFPYEHLVEENGRRDRTQPEYELLDTGIFDEDRYFDVLIEYAKASPRDLLLRITATNRGPQSAPLVILPQLWFRNTWTWRGMDKGKPTLAANGQLQVLAHHPKLGEYHWHVESANELLFCENETNLHRLYGKPVSDYVKDAFHDYVIEGRIAAVNPKGEGTKAGAYHRLEIPAGEARTVRLRLTQNRAEQPGPAFADFDQVFTQRIAEADAFYACVQEDMTNPDARHVHRQALAGMVWNKQYYHYDVAEWLKGDPAEPTPPAARRHGRNSEWSHVHNAEVLSMPDKWEYPWFAAWDLAFHCIPLAHIDPDFAKNQLVLLLREWYMHPNGQLPAYEWQFDDVNPPVHAWAAWRVYQIDRRMRGGKGDFAFLERVFHKLLLNFTWWVNRKDAGGRNIFRGGFLGLDNIGVFDRSRPLPGGAYLAQADATSWMAMYALNLLRMSLELALTNHVYEDIASKFFEHFLQIASAINQVSEDGCGLWDPEDEFYYDKIQSDHGPPVSLKIRSIVGLIPLFAVETLEPELLAKLPEFTARMTWYLKNRPDLAAMVSRWDEPGRGRRRLLSLLRGHRMKALLKRMLDPEEFLSDFGVRALSRYHLAHPYVFECEGFHQTVTYQPAESDSALFGGNSNWRGPVWFPINYLIIESLQRFYHYYGDEFLVEYPTGSGQQLTLDQIAEKLGERLGNLFLPNAQGERPGAGHSEKARRDPHFRDHVLFHEYFHGDDGRGLGASHQTGWTGLIGKLLRPRRKDH